MGRVYDVLLVAHVSTVPSATASHRCIPVFKTDALPIKFLLHYREADLGFGKSHLNGGVFVVCSVGRRILNDCFGI